MSNAAEVGIVKAFKLVMVLRRAGSFPPSLSPSHGFACGFQFCYPLPLRPGGGLEGQRGRFGSGLYGVSQNGSLFVEVLGGGVLLKERPATFCGFREGLECGRKGVPICLVPVQAWAGVSALGIWVQGDNVESYHLMVGASQMVLINGPVCYFPSHCRHCDREIDYREAYAVAVVVGWCVGDIDKVPSMVLDECHYLVCTSVAFRL
jgi:hypothetical protein